MYRKKSDDRIFHEICEQLEIRGELTNRENAFGIMVHFLTYLYDSVKSLRKENSELNLKVARYEKNATLLFQINQPTATIKFVVDCLNKKDLEKVIKATNSMNKIFLNRPVKSFEPTEKPYEYIVVIDNTSWVGFNTYEDALKIAVKYEYSTIWSLEWDKYKGDWKLCNGEQFSDGMFLANTHFDYLHYGTLNSFLEQIIP